MVVAIVLRQHTWHAHIAQQHLPCEQLHHDDSTCEREVELGRVCNRSVVLCTSRLWVCQQTARLRWEHRHMLVLLTKMQHFCIWVHVPPCCTDKTVNIMGPETHPYY